MFETLVVVGVVVIVAIIGFFAIRSFLSHNKKNVAEVEAVTSAVVSSLGNVTTKWITARLNNAQFSVTKIIKVNKL